MSPHADKVPPHFIVFVPGWMGSKLRDPETDEIVWVRFSPTILLRPHRWLDNLFSRMALPYHLEPAGIMDEIVFVPPWAKHEEYSRLVEAMEDWGYQVDPEDPQKNIPTAYTFAYDWRQDNRVSAQKLDEAIERWRTQHPGTDVWIVAHSNGGLVARWYIEKLGGKDHVGRLFLMGSPWDGSPKSMDVLFDGLEVLFRRWFNPFGIRERTRDMIRSFPSAYQLLPHVDPFLHDPNNQPVDYFDGAAWLNTPEQKALLQDGREFNEDLGTTLSVETMCFFGRKRDTTTHGVVRFEAGGRWDEIEWDRTEAGDGTIPERSAVHPKAKETIPFAVGHGDIYVSDAVLEILEWELIDKYLMPSRAAIMTEHHTIVFEPNQDIYSPGETIHLWATVHKNEAGSPPVSRASVRVQFEWQQALPGAGQVVPPQGLSGTRLGESEETPGRYEGSLVAPDVEGYYKLRARVKVVGKPTTHLAEMIAIEAIPEAQVDEGAEK